MTSAAKVMDAWSQFSEVAGACLHIQDEAAYQEALTLVNDLMEQSEDSVDDPLKPVLDLLFQSIDAYEMQDKHFLAFHDEAMGIPKDLAALGVLMDQYRLGVNDLPEIGSKSLVSRILSGQRNLTKKHIQALSKRFGISPAGFFD